MTDVAIAKYRWKLHSLPSFASRSTSTPGATLPGFQNFFIVFHHESEVTRRQAKGTEDEEEEEEEEGQLLSEESPTSSDRTFRSSKNTIYGAIAMASGISSNTFKAIHSNDLPYLKPLILENANVEERGRNGITPLTAGIKRGHFEIVKYLVT
eukprot:jgi/Bigna1/137517/aug1.39_g12225